jgi:uncharacterized protein
MSRLLDLSLAAIGHFAIAVWLFNRLHAVALPRPAIKVLEKLLLLSAASILILFVVQVVVFHHRLLTAWNDGTTIGHLMLSGYVAACWLAVALSVPCWLVPKLRERKPGALVSNDTTQIDVAARLGFRPVHGMEAGFFASLPGNELLQIALQRKTLRLPSLPRQLEGLSIAHLSDLHMTGKVGREFYDIVVDETNALNADLVVITGDILENKQCLPWIASTFSRLHARHGKYFILGNHERRLADVSRLRQALGDAGLADLGGRCQTHAIRGLEILLAGNERPWFGNLPEIPYSRFRAPDFRILLSHTPDQLPWARSKGFDLMLAGHNHGGQIRFPYLGALIAPSLYGCRYAGGLYFEPPTMLHVSRGLGGIHLIRLNCPPELALLTLTCE